MAEGLAVSLHPKTPQGSSSGGADGLRSTASFVC